MSFDVLLAQETYPRFQNNIKPHPAVVAPGDIFLPPMAGEASEQSPSCAEWTRSAGNDESLVITGNQFSNFSGSNSGKDTRFKIFGSTGFRDSKIQRLDTTLAIVSVKSESPKWEMYFIWPGNHSGFGNPIAINKTDAWWVGPDTTTRGRTISIYGRNLSRYNDTLSSFIYLQGAMGDSQWATVTRVNPYKVDFLIPPNLKNGSYEIWVHNGHGGDYGWSTPLRLIIKDTLTWTNRIFNVKSYDAKGNGINDDTHAILKTIEAASQYAGSTVYFPTGTYSVKSTLYLKSNVKYIGDGETSLIRCATDFTSDAWGLLYAQNQTNVLLENLWFDGNGSFKGKLTSPIYFRACSNFRIKNVAFRFQGYNLLDLANSNNVFIDNSKFIGMISFLGNCSQLFIDKCDFKLTNDAEMALHSWGGKCISITNSFCSDFDNRDVANGKGWGMGRFFVGNGNWGSNRLTYLGSNVTSDLTVRPLEVDQNVGEQFMWEGNNTVWSGSPTASTSTTTTCSGFNNANYNTRLAVVVKGKGLGQSRLIVGRSSDIIHLETPWNIIPDQTSIINIGAYIDRIVIYDNYLDGKNYAATSLGHNASAGIEPFGGCFNLVADRNILHELRQGISNWVTRNPGDKGLEPNYFNLFVNNKFVKCRSGINNSDGNWNQQLSSTEGTGMLGIMYRRNEIEQPLETAIKNNLSSSDYPVFNGIVYEHNTVNNAPVGFQSQYLATDNHFFYKNIFRNESSDLSSFAIQNTFKSCLRDNEFFGYASNYSAAESPMIEAPYHVLNLSGTINSGVIESSFTLYNSGTSDMDWNAVSDSRWLTIQVNSGNIEDETKTAEILLSADPTGLSVGTHIAYITVSSGKDMKVYSVVFNNLYSPTLNYFRSKKTAKWNDVTAWQSCTDSITWMDTGLVPSLSAQSITICNSHTIRVTDTLEIDQLTIQSGGVLSIAPNASVAINNGPGDDITIADSASLVVKSDSTGTGRVSKSTGTIKGNVTVERYITSRNNSANRLIGPSVNTAGGSKPFIRDNWQEGQSNSSLSPNNNIIPGYGTHINGSNTDGKGFDMSKQGTPSLRYYDQALPTPVWVSVPSTNTTSLEAKKGYLLAVHGDRSADSKGTYLNTNTTLRATGQLLMGTQTFLNLEGNGRLSIIANPYASPINWKAMWIDTSTKNSVNFKNYFTYLDPNVGTSGASVTVNLTGVKSINTNATLDIQSGEAFYVRSNTGVINPTFTIKESHKSSTNDLNIFRVGLPEQFFTTLYYTTAEGRRILSDGVNNIFSSEFSKSLDQDDAEDVASEEENIAIFRNGKLFSIEARPLLTQTDTLMLLVQRLQPRKYELEFSPMGVTQSNLNAYLEDKFLKTRTTLSLTNPTLVPFSVNSTPESAAENRFQVVFEPNVILPVTITSLKAFPKQTGIQVAWTTEHESSIKMYDVEKSLDGQQFRKLGSVPAEASISTVRNYSWFDNDPKDGTNYYRIKIIEQSGVAKYSQVVNVRFTAGKGSFDVYPNPVKGNNSILIFSDIPKGIYTVKLISSTGQLILKNLVNHPGGSASHTFSLDPHLPKGSYTVQITGNATTFNKQILK